MCDEKHDDFHLRNRKGKDYQVGRVRRSQLFLLQLDKVDGLEEVLLGDVPVEGVANTQPISRVLLQQLSRVSAQMKSPHFFVPAVIYCPSLTENSIMPPLENKAKIYTALALLI
jgi:hypothetical protein